MVRKIFGMGLVFLLAVQLYAKELGRLRVLTYNVFGVLIAPDRKVRMEKIGEEVAKLNPDLIGFQEAFEARHRRILLKSLEESGWGKAYSYYEKKWYGPGIWILSKYPMESCKTLNYSVNGTPFDSDYYAKKGVNYARIQTPYGPLDFFNTHIIARYTNLYDSQGRLKEEDWLKADRLLQAEQMARFIQETNQRSGSRSLVAVGDFNSPPVLLEYPLFQSLSGLVNVQDEVPLFPCPMGGKACNLERRIDHIFYQNYFAPEGFYLKPERAELVFFEKVETRKGKLKLSDHNGLLVEFLVLSADDSSVRIGDRSQAKVLQVSAKPELNELARDLEDGRINPEDSQWQNFALQTLWLLNQKKLRHNKIPITVAKILTNKLDPNLSLEPKDLKNLKQALEIWEKH